MKNLIYFALSLLTILPGCFRSTKSKEIGIGVSYETIITDKYWKLLQLKGKTIAAVEGQVKEPGFFLDGKDKKISGNGGCNTFFGTYSLSEGSRISFSEIGSTKMACPDMDTESHFLQVLSETDNYALWGDTLVLYKGKMGPLAKLVIILYK